MNAGKPALPWPVPLPMLAANVLGMALIAAGAMAIQSPGLLPGLADPGTAWALIGAGALVESGSAFGIVMAVRAARGRPSA